MINQSEILQKFQKQKEKIINEDNNYLAGSKNPLFIDYSIKDYEKRLSIGCDTIDQLLNGGIPLERIIEVSGEAGSGKTQLALQFSLNFIKKEGNRVYYFTTQKKVHDDKLGDMIGRFGESDFKILKRINTNLIFKDVDSKEDFKNMLDQFICPSLALQMGPGGDMKPNEQGSKILVVLDNIYSLCEQETYTERSKIARDIGYKLKYLTKNRVSAQVLNNVIDLFKNDNNEWNHNKNKKVSALGQLWENIPHEKYSLKKLKGNHRKFKREFSKSFPRDKCQFYIEADGLHGDYYDFT